ncbi:putative H/ACA ribonucleoprotein complex subunit 1-like protein 1 [Ananas comosus]|uniref:H/ACA ribonucleoprotein complex subunit n=1 Tax=Ananas comosus TaxID=4615 RepID=A0A199UWH2_ANACO|nr:putative H/ACA ribonucleoprotein complex subunit 1-like protein 1 [Ananas comosus]
MRPPRGGGGFRGRGGGRGGGGGFRGGGFRGGGRGGGGFRDEGPPAEVVEVSSFLHACEGDAVTKLTNEKIPYFNAPIYLQNKTQIGKVDEIFGPINESCFSIKMMEGIIATSYSLGDKFFIDPAKLLPLSRFLPQPKYDFFPPSPFCCMCYIFARDSNKLGLEAADAVAEEAAGVVAEEAAVVASVEEVAAVEAALQEAVVVVVLGAAADHNARILDLNLVASKLSC